MTHENTKKRHMYESERGQSLIEISLGLIAIIFVLSGLIDIGRAYFAYIALEDAAGEAVLFMSINSKCPRETSGPTCADPNNAEYRMVNAGGQELNWDNVNFIPIPENTSGLGVGDTVEVRLEYDFRLITPIISDIVGDDKIKLSVRATQIIITEVDF